MKKTNQSIDVIDEMLYILNGYKKSKDFVKSPFRYPGGKFYALKHIIPFLCAVPHDEYREPFVGGGSVFFGKKKAKFNWINDLENKIVEVYKGFSDKKISKEIISILDNEIASRERHTEVKNLIPENDIEKIFQTFYLNRTSYSGIINSPAWGYKDGKSSPPQNWGNFIRNVFNKLQNIKITSLDFEHVVTSPPIGNSVLLYLDPPYFHADQRRAYTKPFELDDHIRLSTILNKTNYFFCLSYDDVDEIRDLYSWANIYERKWLYNTANKKNQKRDIGNELIITNYKVSHLENGRLFNF